MENNAQAGPRAPKDPQKKRSGFYIMVDKTIEATERLVGKASQEVYLDEGRLAFNAKLVGGVNDEVILNNLKDCKGFLKTIHSIGVSVIATEETGKIDFVLQNYGKTNRYGGGTIIRKACTNDGSEIIINLDDYNWSADDDVVGKIAFEFEKPELMARATVKFYLRDGYEVPESQIDPPVQFDSPEYKAMIAKSLLNLGNNRRIKKAIDKAKNGEEVTIAFIGGSITQGAGAKPINKKCYAYLAYEMFKEKFGVNGGENIHFIKAGVGGTPSELGMIRYDRDVLRNGSVKPDIVIVEFAVNDEGDETKGVCYESLVRSILSADNKPAVLLLFAVFANDWNLQERLSPVGKLYNLPMVSISDAVVNQFKLTKEQGNIITKRQYFYDIFHPTNDGHKIMADSIEYLFEEADKCKYDENDISLDKKPVLGNCFEGIHLIDREEDLCNAKIECGSFTAFDEELQCVEMDDNYKGTMQFPYNWQHTPESGDKSFKLTVKSKSLLLVYKESGRMDFGEVEVYVDGEYFKTIDPKLAGWTHCNPIILYKQDIAKEHKVEIKMAEGSIDKYFTILGFGYN